TVVDVQVGVAAVRAGSNVGYLGDDVPRQLALVSDVPLLDDSPIKALARAWEGFSAKVRRPHENLRRQLHPPGIEIRDRNGGDTAGQRSHKAELIGGIVEGNVVRERTPQRARPGERIDGAAIAGPHHRFLTNAVRGAQSRRQVPGLEFKSDI